MIGRSRHTRRIAARGFALPSAGLVAALVTAAACGLPSQPPDAPSTEASAPTESAEAAAIIAGPLAFHVTTARPVRTARASRTHVQGTVVPAPRGLVQVRAPAPGFVSYPAAAPMVGQAVTKGETLALFRYHFELHDAVHLLNERWVVLRELLGAERERARAHVEYERLEQVAQAGGASRAEVLAARTRWQVAETEAQTWTRRLALHDAQIQASEPNRQPIIAPVTGVIAAAYAPHGQLAHEGDALIEIVDLSSVWIEGALPTAAAPWVNRADTAWIAIPGSGEAPRKGERKAIVPLVDEETPMLKVQFSVPNPDHALRLGMSVDLYVEHGDTHDALTVPKSAVVTRDGRSFVFVRIPPDSYERREVRVVADDPEALPIDGLAADADVVIDGQEQLWTLSEAGGMSSGRTPATSRDDR